MPWWRRIFQRRVSSPVTAAEVKPGKYRQHLEDFASTRRDVEAFIEPATTVNRLSLLLVARDGEWTRRTVPSEKEARAFAKHMDIPIFDVLQSGYPSAMREFNARVMAEQKARHRNDRSRRSHREW